MNVPAPHFLLYAEAAQAVDAAPAATGRWRFVLRLPGGETSLEAADEEPAASRERLELLAVVRGLESLEQPSRVTLLSGSRQLRRGLEFGLSQWRENDWQWERYGRMSPVKNGDLWRRLDRLLEIHKIDCGPARLDKADDLMPGPAAVGERRLRFDRAEEPRGRKERAAGARLQANSNHKSRGSASRLRRTAVPQAIAPRGGTRMARFRALNCVFSALTHISGLMFRGFGRVGQKTWARAFPPFNQHDQDAAWHVACGNPPRR